MHFSCSIKSPFDELLFNVILTFYHGYAEKANILEYKYGMEMREHE